MGLGEALAKKLNKDMKDDIAMVFPAEDDGSITDVKIFIPTGCTELDFIIRNAADGGIPVGKISSIAGLEATGKSLFAMQVMANAQKMGGFCVYIDTEQGLNTDFAKRVGLDVSKDFLHVGRMVSCEDVFRIIFEVCSQISENKAQAKKDKVKPYNEFAIVVWDSVAATPTALDLKAENPDPGASIAVKPRILSKNINLLLRNAQRQDVAFLFINQLRENIGAMVGQDKHVEPGGKAIPYASSVRMRIQSIGKMKDNKSGDVYGIKTRVKLVKNRFGPPHRTAEFPIYFSYGFDDEESMVDVLKIHEKVHSKNGGRNGTTFYFSGDEAPIKEDSAIKLVEFKSKIRNDKLIRAWALKMMEEALVKDLVDPRELVLDVVKDEESSI